MNWNPLLWVGFVLFILLLLFIDLKVFHRKSHEVKIKEALIWSLIWISISLLFNYFVYIWEGKVKGMEFLAAYLIEKSLSVDNLFVFILLFGFFEIKPQFQHKILFWGIMGAMVMRAIFIIAGISLITKFHWIIYFFGAFLIYTGIKIPFEKDDEHVEMDKRPYIKFLMKIIPITTKPHQGKLFIRENHRFVATSLFITLVIIEVSDLVFAVDSIPAVLAISNDPFIVYTSNVFAILGLRALYFALAGIINYFKYLKYGLAAILVFVGVKMCISGFFEIPITISLLIILGVLVIAIIFSLLFPGKDTTHQKHIKKTLHLNK